jgi:hypothetical protein
MKSQIHRTMMGGAQYWVECGMMAVQSLHSHPQRALAGSSFTSLIFEFRDLFY